MYIIILFTKGELREMKKLKKLITLVAAMCMIFSMATIVFASEAEELMYRGQAVEVTVAADTENAYYAYGVGGTILTINDADAYVLYGTEKYEAVDGVVEVAVTSSNPRIPVDFTIGNSSNAEKTFSVDFVYPLGSQMNPEVIEDSASIYAQIAEGNDQGYFVKFTAPADGLFTFEITGAGVYDEENDTYTELGWSYVVNQLTYSKYGDTIWSDSEEAEPSTSFEVKEGDEIEIILNTYDPNSYAIPVGAVDAYISFEYPEGSINNPIGIWETPTEIEIPAGSDSYYQGYFAGQTVTISGDNVAVVYNDKKYIAENGVITIECAAQGMGRPMPNVFQIINKEKEDINIKVDAKYPIGHMDNPAELVIGENKATVEAGAQGYFFTWISTGNGILKVTFDEKTDWQYVVNNMTTYEYGDMVWSDSDPAVPTTSILVSKGDEIQVLVNTYDPEDEWNTPAGTVVFNASIITEDEITDILGKAEDVEEMEELYDSVTVEDNASGTKIVGSEVALDDFVAVLELAKDVLKDYYVMDITLVDADDNPVQPEEGKKVKVTLNVPFKLEGAKVIEVFWLNGDKLVSVGKSDVVNGKISFDAEHFSAYVFADATPVEVPTTEENTTEEITTEEKTTEETTTEKPSASTPDAPSQQTKPGDSANLLMLFAVAVVAGAVVLARKKTVTE